MKHFPPLMKDVFTHDSKCDVGSLDEHSHSEALEENMIPLAPPGADPPIIEIDFYPDWSESTCTLACTAWSPGHLERG